MQIYSKSMKNATSPLFRNHNRSALPAGTYITHRVIYYPLVLLNSPKLSCGFDLQCEFYGNQIYPCWELLTVNAIWAPFHKEVELLWYDSNHLGSKTIANQKAGFWLLLWYM